MVAEWLGQVFSHPGVAGGMAIAAKTALIYLFLVAGLRLLGSRELGELSAYDFVLVVVLANSVQNALVGGDSSLGGGLISALTLLVANRVVTALLRRFPMLHRGMVGEPVVLISEGAGRWRRMAREGIQRDELLAALREHGVASIQDVRLAVLEVDGQISVVPRQGTVHRVRRHVGRLRAQ